MVSVCLADLQTDEKLEATVAAAAQSGQERTLTENPSKSAAVHAATTAANDDDAPRHDRSDQD